MGVFESIDADNDDILSYSECVAFVTEMYKSDIILLTLGITKLAPAVKDYYGYDYELEQNNNNKSMELFIEYSTMILFFIPYDIDQTGYIRHDDFIYISSQVSLVSHIVCCGLNQWGSLGMMESIGRMFCDRAELSFRLHAESSRA